MQYRKRNNFPLKAGQRSSLELGGPTVGTLKIEPDYPFDLELITSLLGPLHASDAFAPSSSHADPLRVLTLASELVTGLVGHGESWSHDVA